jgi:AraC family transcriptional regulator, regulatory protein of adaptative response / DNA-3-methyladenine glycosylase II
VSTLDPDDCYRALSARDPRFDGVFLVGVESTGIYCRPVCPARTPKRSSCRFFERAAVAEHEGFRACLRCRPERAPGHAPVDEGPEIVRRALAKIAGGALDRMSVDELARTLGITGRHLRRALEAAVGVTPVELAQSRRLGLAKWLIQDTQLSMTDVASASGYESIRRFNASVAARFGCAPSALRRAHPAADTSEFTLRLEARPPFPGVVVLQFLRGRAVPGVEHVTETSYRRWVVFGDAAGWVHAELDRARPGVVVKLDVALLPHVTEIVARLRALFDLDARPDVIDDQLGRDPALARHVARVPGMRVPGAFDPWELAVRAILGQQVSVRGATTVSGRLVQRFGAPVSGAPGAWTFPTPRVMARATVDQVCKIGIPGARGATIVALAEAIERGVVDLSRGAAVDETVSSLQGIRGIGPWTAHYVAMRALRAPDMFLASDLAAKKALGVARPSEAEALSARWRPWRAYALMHLWNSLAQSADQGG